MRRFAPARSRTAPPPRDMAGEAAPQRGSEAALGRAPCCEPSRAGPGLAGGGQRSGAEGAARGEAWCRCRAPGRAGRLLTARSVRSAGVAGGGGNGNDFQWCFSQVKGAVDEDVAEGEGAAGRLSPSGELRRAAPAVLRHGTAGRARRSPPCRGKGSAADGRNPQVEPAGRVQCRSDAKGAAGPRGSTLTPGSPSGAGACCCLPAAACCCLRRGALPAWVRRQLRAQLLTKGKGPALWLRDLCKAWLGMSKKSKAFYLVGGFSAL